MPQTSKTVTIGGKVTPLCCALSFTAIEVSVLKLETKCRSAHQAVLDRTSNDGDFLTDDDIKRELETIRQKYLECEAVLIQQLTKHRAYRGIHQNRREVERRSRLLAAAEAKFLQEH